MKHKEIVLRVSPETFEELSGLAEQKMQTRLPDFCKLMISKGIQADNLK